MPPDPKHTETATRIGGLVAFLLAHPVPDPGDVAHIGVSLDTDGVPNYISIRRRSTGQEITLDLATVAADARKNCDITDPGDHFTTDTLRND